MTPQSSSCSVVARNFKGDQRDDREMSSVFKRQSTKQGTLHADLTSSTPLVEDGSDLFVQNGTTYLLVDD